MNNYTLLTNKLFYAENKTEETLYNQHKDYKLLPVMDYLYINTNRKGTTIATLEDMIIESGFKVDTHKGKSIDQFKEILKFLQFNKIIDLDLSIDDIKKNELIKCTFNGIDKNDKGDFVKFTILHDEDKEKILSYDETKIDNLKLLYYFCYLSARMYKRSNNESEDIRLGGGRAETCFASYEQVKKDIGLTDNTIKQYNDILVELGLIAIGNLGLYYNKLDKNKYKQESPNFYAFVNGNEDDELREAMKVFKKDHPNYVFLNTREYKNNNRKMNGYISRIEQLEKEGKATTEQIEKKNDYIESKDMNDDTIKELKEQIMKLVKIDETEIDSYIYSNIDKEFYSVDDLNKLISDIYEENKKYKHKGIQGTPVSERETKKAFGGAFSEYAEGKSEKKGFNKKTRVRKWYSDEEDTDSTQQKQEYNASEHLDWLKQINPDDDDYIDDLL